MMLLILMTLVLLIMMLIILLPMNDATAASAESDLHQRDGGGIGDCDLVNADNYVADNDVDDAADYE